MELIQTTGRDGSVGRASGQALTEDGGSVKRLTEEGCPLDEESWHQKQKKARSEVHCSLTEVSDALNFDLPFELVMIAQQPCRTP